MKLTKQTTFLIMGISGLLVLIFLLVYSLLKPPVIPQESDVLITLERTMCFGKCPAYVLTIYNNGVVTFAGEHYVEAVGLQRGLVTPQQLKTLLDEFKSVGFINERDYTDRDRTDGPSIILSLTQAGETKQVEIYLGDNDVPQELIDLAEKIDEITNSKQWIGR